MIEVIDRVTYLVSTILMLTGLVFVTWQVMAWMRDGRD